ncbi:DUF1016 family protein [candidate division KSB1 bacterium]|nr:DUF1016 family protein [candidate division KSB1 bacterium]
MEFTNPTLLKAIEAVQHEIRNNPDKVQESKDVINRYGKLFHPNNLKSLSEEEFRGFLNFKNNKHWTGIHRQVGALTANMNRLREALNILLNEAEPLEKRLRKIRPASSEPFIKGLARSVITPILFLVYPQKYGVLNAVAEEGLKLADIYPDLSSASDFAEQYIEVNNILTQISSQFELHLWFVDWIWWKIREVDISEDDDTPNNDVAFTDTKFGLEKYLHEFLLENWQNLDISKEWALLEKDDEIVGSEYKTDVGRIDLLAHHVTKPEWLVIELKRNQAVDTTVGQVLRYMGWVKKNLANSDEKVKGLIVAKEGEMTLNYALSQINNVSVKRYNVQFELSDYILE